MIGRKRRWTMGCLAVLLAGALGGSPAMANHRHHERAGHRDQYEGHAHQSKGNVVIDIGYRHGNRHHVARRVLVPPGYHVKRWVPAMTETRYDECDRPYTVVIRKGCYETVWVPARYVTHDMSQRHDDVRCRQRRHQSHHGNRSGIHVFGHFRF